jgi:subtilisin family serine protease
MRGNPRRLVLGWGLFLGLAAPSCAALGKLDAPLRIARESYLKSQAARTPQGLTTEKDSPVLDAFLRLAPGEGPEFLAAAYPRVTVRTIAGGVATAFLPMDLLPALEADPRVAGVSLSRRMAPRMDVARSSAVFEGGSLYGGILESGASDLNGVDGTGVVVGVVDSGIDWRHADFDDAGAQGSRRSRIAFLWDQTISSHTQGPFPSGYSYGAQYTGAQIDAKNNGGSGDVRSEDSNGHGTHVAGIAAGSGQATDGREPAGTYRGMAHKASLVVVKTNFENTGITDAVAYVIARARDMGKRAVVNLSLGGGSGPHDGTDDYETATAALAASTPIIVAMGNEQEDAPHARAEFAASGATLFSTEKVREKEAANTEFWHPSKDGYAVTVTLACSSACPGSLSVSSGANDSGSFGSATVFVNNATNPGHPRGDRQIFIQINDPAFIVTAGHFLLTRTSNGGSGVVDGFTYPETATKFTTQVDNTMTLGEPASANNVISVGAYATKGSWRDNLGLIQSLPSPPTLGDIASFSSRGPTRDGRIKPAIAAPGQAIGAAFSSFKTTDTYTLYDGRHMIMQGTSMAAPVVTGFAALKLQVMPSASVPEVLADLVANARVDAKVAAFGNLPNSVWGSGKLAGSPKVRDAPQNLQAAVLGVSSVAWAWSAVRNASFYEVYCATSPGVRITSVAAAALTLTGLRANTTYAVLVKGANPVGAGPGSSSSGRSTLAAAPAFTSPTSASSCEVSLSWDANGNPEGTLYEAMITSADAASAVSSETFGTSAAFHDLAPNTSYYLQVRAFNHESIASPFDAETGTVTLAEIPGPPSLLARGSSALSFQWASGGNPNDTAYAAQLSTEADFGSLAGSSSTLDLHASWGGLMPDTTYYFRVRARDRIGRDTGFSAAVSTGTQPLPPAQPVLRGHSISSCSIRWTWTESDEGSQGSSVSSARTSAAGHGDADHYYLFSSSGGLIAELPGSATHYQEAHLSSATRYSRFIEAENEAGEAFSSTMTAATPEEGYYLWGTSSHTLVASNGKTELDIPPALLGDATGWMLSDSPLDNPLMSDTVELIAAAASPAGLRASTESLTEFLMEVDEEVSSATLSLPVTVRVPYSDSLLPGFVDGTSPPVRVETLRLCTLNPDTVAWELVPGSRVDAVRKVVEGQVNHLSIFGAFGSGAAQGLSSVRVYPMPFKPNGADPDQGRPYSPSDPGSGIIFDNLPGNVAVKIYTITGQKVASLGSESSNGKLRWDARNESGQDVATGGYFAVITSPGARVVKKILILR